MDPSMLMDWTLNVCYSLRIHFFMCPGQEVTFIRIDQGMKLTEAQSYCREHYTDLASVRGASENEQIRQLVPSREHIRIGLYRDSWKWVDGRNLLASNWSARELSHSQNNCVAVVLDANATWEVWNCSTKMPFFCYGRKPRSSQPLVQSLAFLCECTKRANANIQTEQSEARVVNVFSARRSPTDKNTKIKEDVKIKCILPDRVSPENPSDHSYFCQQKI